MWVWEKRKYSLEYNNEERISKYANKMENMSKKLTEESDSETQ